MKVRLALTSETSKEHNALRMTYSKIKFNVNKILYILYSWILLTFCIINQKYRSLIMDIALTVLGGLGLFLYGMTMMKGLTKNCG